MPSLEREYGKIFKGNNPSNDSPKVFAEKYMEKYKDFIYSRAALSIDPISGDDVEETVNGLKETAGGLDQLDPADLKLLSREACQRLASLFNMIEEGCSWPKQLNVARAAFLAKEEDSDMDPMD